MKRRNTIDVLGLGAVAVDDLIFVESYPPPDAKAQVARRERHCGGLTATALVAAARLGARCAYAGVLGHDELSGFALSCLVREGIDVSCAQRNSSARPIHSNIVVDQQHGTRNIFYDLEGVVGASIRTPARLIRSCRVLFVDHMGVPGMVRAARLARRAGIPVVADLEMECDPQFPQLLALADHLILSRDFARAITGTRSPAQAVRKLARPDRQVAVVTCGDEGCWYLARGEAVARRQPAFKVGAVDTTGCGDVFHGAYAFALARGLGLEERIRFAAATAALKATRPGGQAGIPSLAAVRRLLKNEYPSQSC
jgi:sugar/nucleoside kinase (ribokinase family)